MSDNIIDLQDMVMALAVDKNTRHPNQTIKQHWLPRMLLKDYQIPKKQTKWSKGMDFRILMCNPTSLNNESNYIFENNKYKFDGIKKTKNNNNINNIHYNYYSNIVKDNKKYMASSSLFAHQKIKGGGYYSQELETYYSLIESAYFKATNNYSLEKTLNINVSILEILYAHSLTARNPMCGEGVQNLTQLKKSFRKFIQGTDHFKTLTLNSETPLFPLLSEIPFTYYGSVLAATVLSSNKILIRVPKSLNSSYNSTDALNNNDLEKLYFEKVNELVKSNVFIIPTSQYFNY